MRWRTPEEASDHLWQKYRIKRNARRLAQLRADGEGPHYFRDGNVVRYREDLLDAWAEQQLGEPLGSTSEESARRLLTTAAGSADPAPEAGAVVQACEPAIAWQRNRRRKPACPA
jgi:hypothetical protein